jgi:hypothetical protein
MAKDHVIVVYTMKGWVWRRYSPEGEIEEISVVGYPTAEEARRVASRLDGIVNIDLIDQTGD